MEHMYLALDIGEKRIGLAAGSTIPFGRGTIEVTSPEVVLNYITDIIQRDHITACVIGIPYVKSGLLTSSQQLAHEWADRIRETFNIPVETVDETLTSREAERQLREEGIDTEKYRERIDERAAELILAQYIAEHPQTAHA